jgi:ADP-ribose pyrophosphatase
MARLTLGPPNLRKWMQLRSDHVGSFRIFDVCRIELVDGAARPRGDAFTMRCRDWCNVVAITPTDEVVLVWQYRFGTDALSLEIPGGVVEVGEEPAHAAERELLEETGYQGEEISPLVVVEPNPAIQNNRCFTFVSRRATRVQAPSLDPQEEIETVLLPVSRLSDLLDSGQITHALVQGALEAYYRKCRDPALR